MSSKKPGTLWRAALLLCAILCTTHELALGNVLGPTSITYFADGVQQIHVFAINIPGGHLVADAWDGAGWTWYDLGLPPAAGSVAQPAAITYADDSGMQQIRVFALADNGHLVADAWDGGRWTWYDLGLPPSVTWVDQPVAVTYLDGAGVQQIRVFALGSNGNLVADAWDGGGWTWYDLGLPPGVVSVGQPTAITYADDAGIQQIRVFGLGSNFHLVADAWDGGGWTWYDLGLPPGLDSVDLQTAITYFDAGIQQIRVFARGTPGGDLVADAWDGGGWTWYDLGLPGVGWRGVPAAITYADAGSQQIRVFAAASNGDLVADAWDGGSWTWYDLGLPPGVGAVYSPAAINYVDDAGVQQIRVFAIADNGNLVADAWDGGGWTWYNLGQP